MVDESPAPPSTRSSPTGDGWPRNILRVAGCWTTLMCPVCSAEFQRNTAQIRSALKHGTRWGTFCGKSCARKYHHQTDPAYTAKTLGAMHANQWTMPRGVYTKTAAQREANRAHKLRTGQQPTVRGGNGRMAPCEALVGAAMSEWTPQHAVPLGGRQVGYPTCYKLDFAIPERRIGIELDGGSHQSPKGRARDAKKDAKLAELGWSVCRVLNTTVLSKSSTSQLREYLTSLLAAY